MMRLWILTFLVIATTPARAESLTFEQIQQLSFICDHSASIGTDQGALSSNGDASAEENSTALILYNEIRRSFPLSTDIKLFFAPDIRDHRNAIQVPRTTKCLDGTPLIILYPSFTKLVVRAEPGGRTFWKWLFIFYHELAHILLHHVDKNAACETYEAVPGQSEERRLAEEEADLWAGFKLAALGASQSETRAALDAMHSENLLRDSPCYPSLDDRKKAADKGWGQMLGVRDIAFGEPKDAKTYRVLEYRDLLGMDLYSFPSVSIYHCEATCSRQSKRCGAFSFDKRRSFCYLKRAPQLANNAYRAFNDSDSVLAYDAFSETGFPVVGNLAIKSDPKMSPLPADWPTECDAFELTDKGREFFDGPYKRFAAEKVGLSQCREKCRDDSVCLGFSYDKRRCKLFDHITGLRPSTHQGITVHVKRFAYDPTCKANTKHPSGTLTVHQ